MYEKAIDCIVRNHRNSSDFTDGQLGAIEGILMEMESLGVADDLNWRKISELGQDLDLIMRSVG